MPEHIDTQLKKGVLTLCVLTLLNRRDGYAYDIAADLSKAIGMGEGTIYPLMRRMQTDGLVETYLVESAAGPSRKYYRLTAAGRRALEALTAERRTFSDAGDETALLELTPSGIQEKLRVRGELRKIFRLR